MTLLDHCRDLPIRELARGDTLVVESQVDGHMYVVIEGSFDVSRGGASVAAIGRPGAVVGEISALLDTAPSATVVATSPARVHVIDDPAGFMAGDADALVFITCTLAERLERMVTYLADIKVQYGDADGHLGLVDEVLGELTFGEQPVVESGSERDPDPYY